MFFEGGVLKSTARPPTLDLLEGCPARGPREHGKRYAEPPVQCSSYFSTVTPLHYHFEFLRNNRQGYQEPHVVTP